MCDKNISIQKKLYIPYNMSFSKKAINHCFIKYHNFLIRKCVNILRNNNTNVHIALTTYK